MTITHKEAVLICCHAWHAEEFGGAYKLAAEFGQYLSHHEYDVHFLCGSAVGPFSGPAEQYGIKIWRYCFPKATSPSPANLFGHLVSSYKLARTIERRVHINYLYGHSPLQFLGCRYALRDVKRGVYAVHSPFAEELKFNWTEDGGARPEVRGEGSEVRGEKSSKERRTNSQQKLTAKKRVALTVAMQLEKAIYRKADVIQCDSRYSLSIIQEQHSREVRDRGVVCPGWVDLDRFKPTQDKTQIRRMLGHPWESGAPTFLSVRRLERRMGLDNLVEACAILRDKEYKFKLLIGGQGPLRAELEDQIRALDLSTIVSFLGRIPEEKLPLCYAAADCFVLPTRALECFGLIVLEAFASGTPVIATSIGSIPEVMGEIATNGWLCKDTSARAIAGCMKEFIERSLPVDTRLFRRHAESYSRRAVLPRLEKVMLGSCPIS